MRNKKEKIARFGIATKGAVYCLVGGLATMTAFNLGGEKTGVVGSLEYLSDQPFGQILLGAISLGLLGFVFWLFYVAFKDPENNRKGVKMVIKRVGYFVSALFHAFVVYSALKLALTSSKSGSGGGDGQESLMQDLLNQPYGRILTGFIAVVILGKGIYDIYLAYSGKFRKKVKNAQLDYGTRKYIVETGKVGYTARGIVIAIIAYLTLKVAFTANPEGSGGTGDALTFLQNEMGSVVVAIIAIGLIAYGVFMFVIARYSRIAI